MNLTITPNAEKFMRRMVRFTTPGGGFRLTVSPGGCSGLSSEFSVDAAPRAGDKVIELDGLTLFLPPVTCALLEGVTVDFADAPTNSGLVFINPKDTGCGCSSTSAGPATVQLSSITRKSGPPQ